MTINTKNITDHYKTAIGGELLKTNVPEWKMDVFYRKTYSFKTESKIISMQQSGNIVEALVESIISKALDQDGKRLFADADRVTLLNEADPQVIVKLASAINNAAELSKEIISKE